MLGDHNRPNICVVLLLLMMAPLDKAQYAVPYQAQKQELGGYR
jgi:hypothetical protein